MSRDNGQKFDKYYLGLDIGTDSVGWCVTDLAYHILKFNGKAMWGIRLFEAANPAAERRSFRSQRRRVHRRQQRVKLVEELLGEEVAKVDPVFFMRLAESKFRVEDKKEEVRQPFTLFADAKYTDADYHRDYPTIYHLRLALAKHEKAFDIRFYYLAISYFMKHRGHFLFAGDVSQATSFDVVFSQLQQYTAEQMELYLKTDDTQEVQKLLLNKQMGRMDKKRAINTLFYIPAQKDQAEMQKEALSALCGAAVSLDKLFQKPELKEAEVSKFSFADGIDDTKADQLSTILGERFEYILRLKAVYDWSVLTGILSGSSSISEAQVKVYEKHGKDIKDLKDVIRKYLPEFYHEIFWDDSVKENYASYVGHASGKDAVLPDKRITEQKDFCDYLKKKLDQINAEDSVLKRVKEEIENYTFMPKQISKSNSAIPHQVHQQELEQIVLHMGEDYPELAKKDDDGLSVCDKILKIFTFRIPYYVGPLNGYHSDKGGNSWIVRKEGQILPWNFDKMVDQKASAEAFMKRLTNKCTYLMGEDVLPKNSLLYSKYMVLNELNNVKVNGNRLSVEVKQRIYREIFQKNTRKFSLKKLKEWMLKENLVEAEDALSGIDEVFQASLQSYNDFYKIIGTRVDTESRMVENIIKYTLIFGEDKNLLKDFIQEKYASKLSEEEIKAIAKLSYSGWGRFSEKLLNGIESIDHETGEIRTIIQSMWEGQENFMELMSSEHEFKDRVREHNDEIQGNASQEITYDLVRESYVSPAVKRGIWQTLLIIKEIQKVTGHSPARIFVEVAREKEEKPTRKASRKAQLLELYKAIKGEEKEWAAAMAEEINKRDEREFNSKKLYLYYTQMGRDMYTGKPIDLGELFTNAYDVEHIYPQSKTKDDSILNNLILVRSEVNRDKGDVYPIPEKYRQPALWQTLLKAGGGKGLITKEKYDRLMRREPLSDEELASFIGRQLVETRQTTKVVAQILEQTMPETKIVYSKANAVSEFRKDKQFLKSRSVNDYHQAKDAYLNIVVGNVYYTKFTDSPMKYIQDARKNGGKEKYSLNRMFDYDVERNGKLAWKAGEDGTIQTVKKYMAKNNILFTRYATEKRGGFYDQMPLKKGSGQLLPLKTADERYDISKYGGYNKPGINYFMLVESDGKKGRIRTLEGVPVYLSGASQERLLEFCESENGLKLKNPQIVYPEVKINSLLRLDGYPMHISSKQGNQIVMKNAVQLVVSPDEEAVIHKLDKIIERLKENKNYHIDEHDGICEEDIMSIYDMLIQKSNNGIFAKRPASQKNVLINGREKVTLLKMEDQCRLINEILHLFQCKPVTANLKLIEKGESAGKFAVSNSISSYTSAKLINQSITGLFETEIDLLQVKA